MHLVQDSGLDMAARAASGSGSSRSGDLGNEPLDDNATSSNRYAAKVTMAFLQRQHVKSVPPYCVSGVHIAVDFALTGH